LVAYDSDAQSRQPIRLPADLSPYGDFWRYDYVRIGDCFVEHLVRDYGGPNPIDTILNANIDALVPTYPGAESISIDRIEAGKVVVGIRYDHEYAGGTTLYFDYATGKPLS
jgi:hypothetical protein